MKLSSPQQRAKLRCCASCEWIYEGPGNCPKCGFVSYGARHCYGNEAYKYKKTQEPWLKRKTAKYERKLYTEIALSIDALARETTTNDLRECPCPACGKPVYNLWMTAKYLTPDYVFCCEHCHARLRVECVTVTLSEEAGRAKP
jgi:hypothetical protein